MLKTLGAAALKDIIGMLKNEESFFTFDEVKREATLEKMLPSYPVSLVNYLKTVSGDDFMKDLKQALDVFEGFHAPSSKLLEALTDYVVQDLGKALDHLDSAFFFMDYAARLKRLNELIVGSGSLKMVSVDLFANATYQEVTQMAVEAISQIKSIPTIVVQAPIELEASQRMAIRKEFLKKYPVCFPEFHINPSIIGGMRVLIDGEVEDHSWMGKIQSLTNITS